MASLAHLGLNITRGFLRAAETAAQECLLPWSSLLGDDESGRGAGDVSPAIVRLRSLFETTYRDGISSDLGQVVNLLALNSDTIQRAVVAWIDLIEALVQHTERQYGSKPGRGAIKAAEVKSVLAELLRSSDSGTPAVPRALQPFLSDVVVGFTVDTVVRVANQYGLWRDVEEAPQSARARLVIVERRIGQFFQPLWMAVATLASRIWYVFHPPTELSPAVRRALEAVKRDGLIGSQDDLVRNAIQVVDWIATHRKELEDAMAFVFAAVQEAERFGTLTGPEKKAYARDLVFAVLQDSGLNLGYGFMGVLVRIAVDSAIESAAHIFTKRGVF